MSRTRRLPTTTARSPLSSLTVAVLAIILCGALAPARGEIYKWTDAQGTMHFSDQPPPEGTAERVEIRAAQAPAVRPPGVDATPGLAVDQPAAAAPESKRVVMYGAQWCGYCKQARSYFASHNVPYTERDIDRSPAARQEFERLGGGGVPLILVGEARLQGFSKGGFERLYNQ